MEHSLSHVYYQVVKNWFYNSTRNSRSNARKYRARGSHKESGYKIWQHEHKEDIHQAIKEQEGVSEVTNELRKVHFGKMSGMLWKQLEPEKREEFNDEADRRNTATGSDLSKSK